jgi:YVTN family beta-propeller protein
MATLSTAWRVGVGSTPAGIYLTPDGRRLLVGIMGRDHVEVIDVATRQSIKRIRTGKGAHNFRALGDGRIVFVGNRVDNTVSAIDLSTLEVAYSMPVAGGPDDIEITAESARDVGDLAGCPAA